MAGGCRAMMSGRAMLGDERAGEGESGCRVMMSGRARAKAVFLFDFLITGLYAVCKQWG